MNIEIDGIKRILLVEEGQGLSLTTESNQTVVAISGAVKPIKGDPGPSNSITIGTVVSGTTAAATITGDSPNQYLNLVLPKGDTGPSVDTTGFAKTGINGLQEVRYAGVWTNTGTPNENTSGWLKGDILLGIDNTGAGASLLINKDGSPANWLTISPVATNLESSSTLTSSSTNDPGSGFHAARLDHTHYLDLSSATTSGSNISSTAANKIVSAGTTFSGNAIDKTNNKVLDQLSIGNTPNTVAAGDHGHSVIPYNASTSGTLSVDNNRITNLAQPNDPSDAARKSDVDNAVAGLNVKNGAKVTTTGVGENYTINANAPFRVISLTGDATNPKIDGVTVIGNDRILIKNATIAAANGIYYVTSASGNVINVSRATDATTWVSPVANAIKGAYIFISQGTQANNGYIFNGTSTGTFGTDPITFTQFSSATNVQQGEGISVSGTGTVTISVANGGVDLTTKVSNNLPLANGGTASSTASGARSSLGLGNVENTSDSTKNSNFATQPGPIKTALDSKLDNNLGTAAGTVATGNHRHTISQIDDINSELLESTKRKIRFSKIDFLGHSYVANKSAGRQDSDNSVISSNITVTSTKGSSTVTLNLPVNHGLSNGIFPTLYTISSQYIPASNYFVFEYSGTYPSSGSINVTLQATNGNINTARVSSSANVETGTGLATISLGPIATTKNSQRYSSTFANLVGAAETNYAVSGVALATTGFSQFMNNYPSSLAEFVSIDFGINDMALYGPGAGSPESYAITKYTNMLRSAVSRIRSGTVTEVTTSSSTWSGTGSLSNVVNSSFSNGSYTKITGSSKTFTFNINASKFNQYLAIGFAIENGANASASISIDQSSSTARTTVTQSLIFGTNVPSYGSNTKPIVARIPLPYAGNVGSYSGAYTVTINFTINSGSACIDYWALENKETPIAIHEILKTPFYITSKYAASDVDAWNSAVYSLINSEFNDGTVFVVNNTDYIQNTSDPYFFDTLHPNNEGHQRIANAIYNAISNRTGTPKLIQYSQDSVLFTGVGVTNDFNWSKGIWTNVKTTIIPQIFAATDTRGLPTLYNSASAFFKNFPAISYIKDENNKVTWNGLVTKFIVDDSSYSSGSASNGWCYSSDRSATFVGVWATGVDYNANDIVLTNQAMSVSNIPTQYEVAEMPVAYQCIKAHNSSSVSLPQPSLGASSYWSPLRFVRSSSDAKPITTIPSTPSNGLRQTTITNIYSGIDNPAILGEWSASLDYYKGDVVSYKGINYLSVYGTTPSTSFHNETPAGYSNFNRNPLADTGGNYWHPLVNNTTYTRDSVYGALAPRYYKNNIVKSKGMSYIALTSTAPNGTLPTSPLGTPSDPASFLPTIGFGEKIADAPAEFLPSTPQIFNIINESGQSSIIQITSTGLYWYPLNSTFKSKRMAINAGGPGIPGKMAADFEQYNYHYNMGWIDLSSISYYVN